MGLPPDGEAVFVPAHPMSDETGRFPMVEVRRLRQDGSAVGLAFTSVGSLVTTLGEFQPWLAMQMAVYAALLRVQGVDLVHVDPVDTDPVADWSQQRLADGVGAARADRSPVRRGGWSVAFDDRPLIGRHHLNVERWNIPELSQTQRLSRPSETLPPAAMAKSLGSLTRSSRGSSADRRRRRMTVNNGFAARWRGRPVRTGP